MQKSVNKFLIDSRRKLQKSKTTNHRFIIEWKALHCTQGIRCRTDVLENNMCLERFNCKMAFKQKLEK